MPKVLEMAMWRTRIVTTTAPGRIVAPSYPLSKEHDSSWLVSAISCSPEEDFEGMFDDAGRKRSSRGDITLSVEGSSHIAFRADLLALMDAHCRFRKQEKDHRIPALASLWDHFEEAFKHGLQPSRWDEWIPTVNAFADAMKAAAAAWSSYVMSAMGTMSIPVRVPAGKTLVLDRVNDSTPWTPDAVPVVLYLMEREPMELPLELPTKDRT